MHACAHPHSGPDVELVDIRGDAVSLALVLVFASLTVHLDNSER